MSMLESLKQYPRQFVPYAIRSDGKAKAFDWQNTWRWMYNKLPCFLFCGVALTILVILFSDSPRNVGGSKVPFVEPGTVFDYSEFQDSQPGLLQRLQSEANYSRMMYREGRYGRNINPLERNQEKSLHNVSKNALNLTHSNFDSSGKAKVGSGKDLPTQIVRHKRAQGSGTPLNPTFSPLGPPAIPSGLEPANDAVRPLSPGSVIQGHSTSSPAAASLLVTGLGTGAAAGADHAGPARTRAGEKIDLKSMENSASMLVCPVTPPNLNGRQPVVTSATEKDVLDVVLRTGVLTGGNWAPAHCTSRYSVAIIVPVRDRKEQEWAFLAHMHPFLQRQQLNYTIYIVEQTEGALFNRAKLLNVGFVRATQTASYDCVVFHDVDMLPENDGHLYHCSAMPRHMVVASSNNKYKSALSFQRNRYFGGACMMTPQHVWQVNGWSNRYWGWGGEDDDLWRRVSLHDLPVWRWPAALATYTMLPHGAPPGVNSRSYETLAKLGPFHRRDGLNSLHYTLVASTTLPHHTRLLVDVGTREDDPPMQQNPRSLGKKMRNKAPKR